MVTLATEDNPTTRWVAGHPWCWLLIALALVGVFALWLAGPLDWRSGEGSPRDDGEEIKGWGSLSWLLRKVLSWTTKS